MSRSRAEDVARKLATCFSGEIRYDDYTRHLYSSDASMYAGSPLLVGFPRSAEDAAAALEAARAAGAPLLARGAGTSLAGQTVAAEAVVLDFSRHMNRIVALDPEARRAVVQPGVVQDQLNRAAAAHGLMFGPDTSTSNRATIGGMIGNNSAGSHSVRYGSTIDHVAELSVVLSDTSTALLRPVPASSDGSELGTGMMPSVFQRVRDVLTRHAASLEGYPPFWRHSGGYRLERGLRDGNLDLAKLVVGSEGTLVVVTEATVGLVAKPAAVAIALGHFSSVAGAVAATGSALAMNPASVELMDHRILDLSRQRTEFSFLGELLDGSPQALLFVEFFADTTEQAAIRVDELADVWAEKGHAYHTLRAVDAASQSAVLKVRKASLGLLMAASVGTRRPLAFVEDTAVPPESLVAYVRDFREVLDRHGLDAGFYGHCSVGCLHVRPFVDLRQASQVATMRAVAEEVAELAARYGGVNSSEHGDGLARSEFNEQLFGADLYRAMREIKAVFDPSGVLNPGKIVDPPAMTDNLRPLPPPVPLATTLSFTGDGGVLGAADRCMNIGACRKDSTGVMCPSYMATRDEEHSTRGRANALVKAMSGTDPLGGLADERLHEALDLCLECKACKSECPLGVDMAALKSEALHQRHLRRGVPWRSRAFAEIRLLSRLGALAPALTNRVAASPRARALMERRGGVSARRPLPQLARPALRRLPLPASEPVVGEVVLLTDTFTTYYEPEVTLAAAGLLAAAGWSVIPTGSPCCGRPAISKGLLDRARDQAAAMVRQLAAHAERGGAIVGLEPSCLLSLKDEYLRLLPGDARAAAVARQASLIAPVLLAAAASGRLGLREDSPVHGRRILFHGHCHEKALVGTADSRALLELIPGAQVQELDAGCCGMAGSFGYEAEHYELSMKVGGDRLFPVVRAEPDSTLLAASGTSCRQQIAHGTGRKAQHPVELLWQAVRPD